MNRMSPRASLVSWPVSSPLCSTAGPLVWCSVTPISLARMCASVVLPRPGGPHNKDVIERLAAAARGLDVHLQILAVRLLPDELVQRLGPK